MNKHFFTLTELLMAIGIIVILAAIAIPTTASAIKKAEQAKAQAQMAELTNALKNYESTYGKLPIECVNKTDGILSLYCNNTYSEDGSDVTIDWDNDDFKDNSGTVNKPYVTCILMLQNKNVVISIDSKDKKMNPRKIPFLDVQGNTEGVFLDPWGNYYNIVLDGNGDGKISSGIPDGLDVTTLRKDIVIWSKGPDGASGTDDTNKDNVYSIPVDYDKVSKKFVPSR